jgi:hypothetical protein
LLVAIPRSCASIPPGSGITPADGGNGESTTLWVDKASRRVVKMSSIIPQMNGAIATEELTK